MGVTAITFGIQLVNAAMNAAKTGADVYALLSKGKTMMEDMQATGRVPTKEEWDFVSNQMDEAHKQVQS